MTSSWLCLRQGYGLRPGLKVRRTNDMARGLYILRRSRWNSILFTQFSSLNSQIYPQSCRPLKKGRGKAAGWICLAEAESVKACIKDLWPGMCAATPAGAPFRPSGTSSIDGGGCVSTHMSALVRGGKMCSCMWVAAKRLTFGKWIADNIFFQLSSIFSSLAANIFTRSGSYHSNKNRAAL